MQRYESAVTVTSFNGVHAHHEYNVQSLNVSNLLTNCERRIFFADS